MNKENEPSTPISPATLKQKLKSSLCLSWLRHHSENIAPSPSTSTPFATPNPSPRDNNNPRLSRIPSNSWLKSPDIKDKCRNLINRIGHGPGHRHSRSHSHIPSHNHGRRYSADFRYDPSSYALNFDRGMEDSQFEEFPYRNFTARLPPSPTASTSTSTETKVLQKQKSLVL
ncbi:hypothetical protein PTKIN_Ptkin19aG0033600 [Pterospermum kingtungense]